MSLFFWNKWELWVEYPNGAVKIYNKIRGYESFLRLWVCDEIDFFRFLLGYLIDTYGF